MATILKLNKLSTFWLFTILFIGNGARVVLTAPAEDFSDLLSLAPPNREATLEYTDSYGNPIQTSDGKKVVSAKESSESTTPLTQLETLSNSSPVQNYHQSSPTQSFLQLIRSINNKNPPEQRPTTFKPSGFVPLSNGNFNYPNISQDILIINKIASKYKTTLPKLEPLAVAEDPVTESPDLVKIPVAPLKEAEDTQKMAASSQISQTIFDESKVPDWIAAFNDPDVGPAQPYIPDPNMGLSVITWGLVPPKDNSYPIEPIKDSAGKVEITKHSVVEVIPLTTTTTTTTRRPTTTTRWTTTSRTTTRRPTTTRTPYTTTRRTTTTTTTTAAPPTNNKETDIYSLENHIQGQIPEWLADYNDTDLASGVPYEIPSDLNEVKNTVTLGLIAPLAPFTDIAPLKLPSSLLLSTSTTSTTTKRPISSSFSIPSTTKRTTTTTTTTTKRPTTTTTSTSTTTTPSTTTTTVSPLITATEENVFKATLPPWLADFNDPDVGPGVPYVFKDEDENQASDPKGIVESSSNKDEVVVSTTTPTPILSSTTATPAQTFSVPTKGNKGHLASNSVFPSTATAITTHFQKASQHQQQNFQSQFISSSQNQNRVQVNRNSLSSTASSTFSSSPSPFKQSSFGSTSFQASTSPSFNQIPNSSTKFTGRFGGAPGILGEQVTPGFGVRPSAFSKPTTTPATLAPAASNVVERRVTSGSGRYTGGFGGPPGILVPFDNVKKSA